MEVDFPPSPLSPEGGGPATTWPEFFTVTKTYSSLSSSNPGLAVAASALIDDKSATRENWME